MSDRPSPRSSQSVFDQIEEALGATAHGRAFLQECGRRARSEETSLLLDAVARLERRARVRDEALERDEIASLVAQIESALRDARLAFGRSLAQAGPQDHLEEPPTAVDFGRETTSAISDHVEIIQETSWRMRETGIDDALCDALDAQASAIHAACRRQERMLDGLGTIERAIGRADAFVGEMKRALTPMPAPSPVPLVSTAPVTLIDSDIEFVLAPDDDGAGTG